MKPGGEASIDAKVLEALLQDLGQSMLTLAEHKYWTLRITGGDGKIRVEHTFSDSPVTIQLRGSLIERR